VYLEGNDRGDLVCVGVCSNGRIAVVLLVEDSDVRDRICHTFESSPVS
jgi:hypothetical protein